MPVVFVHGVNVRDSEAYRCEVVSRDILLDHLVLEPIKTKGAAFVDLEIANPYWGDHGAQFCWDHSTLPAVGLLEALGDDEQTDASVLDVALAWQSLKAALPRT